MVSLAERRFGRHLPLYLAVVVSLGLLASPQRHRNLVAQVCHSTVLFPFLRLNETLAQWSNLAQENRKLSILVSQLLLENSSLREAKLENERLRRLLNFVNSTRFRGVPAKIIGGSPHLGLKAVVVNVGGSAGVRKNMPVIASDGVVGRVLESLHRTSVVLLLTDPNCRVAAIDRRSRVLGIARWKGQEGMILDNVPIHEIVTPGDTVVSSGLGGIFPEGLRIGVVTKVRSEKGEIFKEIKLKSAVNFNRLEEVYVLRPTAD